uniref:Uncharacterized protein n=1 Tax=Anguilla anguilla TaxID=7936 RepID=A0A0E9VII9_ANGAN
MLLNPHIGNRRTGIL